MLLGGVDVDEVLLQWLLEEIPEQIEALSEECLANLSTQLAPYFQQAKAEYADLEILLVGGLQSCISRNAG
jgi:hypothetical protein